MAWRNFAVTALMGFVVAGSLAAEAQQAGKPVRIGVLANFDTPDMDGLRRGLREQGYEDGANAKVEWRWSEGKAERLPALATELIGLTPDVIVASGTQAVRAAKEATSTIPIVMVAVSYPEVIGLVESLARPGANVTGLSNISQELNAKRLEVLREIAPGISRVVFLWNPTNPLESNIVKPEVAAVALAVNLQFESVEVRTAEEFSAVITGVDAGGPADAVYANGNPVNFRNRHLIAEFALTNNLPSVFGERLFVEAGGLVSYGPSYREMFRRAASYVDRILKGTKPADLPVEQPVKFELVINGKTAKALRLDIPPTLLARADEVIE